MSFPGFSIRVNAGHYKISRKYSLIHFWQSSRRISIHFYSLVNSTKFLKPSGIAFLFIGNFKKLLWFSGYRSVKIYLLDSLLVIMFLGIYLYHLCYLIYNCTVVYNTFYNFCRVGVNVSTVISDFGTYNFFLLSLKRSTKLTNL